MRSSGAAARPSHGEGADCSGACQARTAAVRDATTTAAREGGEEEKEAAAVEEEKEAAALDEASPRRWQRRKSQGQDGNFGSHLCGSAAGLRLLRSRDCSYLRNSRAL
uniref:Uncharacterized protein n=1 Tax=Oryza sativa subsp. japonica TaxID=39947 RepID=Q6YZ91_ORYSJ|nr:hypothetical protein [Oryza sativa Japonica Group]BAD05786.1 hypothetical protein [Oryza sativa Japonica Group]